MERLQKIRLSILVLGTLMGALDSTIVILAFPVIAEELHSDLLTTMWVILIYLLIVASLTSEPGGSGISSVEPACSTSDSVYSLSVRYSAGSPRLSRR